MKIGEIIKVKDYETYQKLMQLSANYEKCMKKKCKDCENSKECFKENVNEI